MKKAFITAAAAIFISLVFSYSFRFMDNSEKIGYVKTGIILQDYKKMHAVNEQFLQELKLVQANLDTLKNRYEVLAGRMTSLSSEERAEWESRISSAQNDYQKYEQQAAQQMEARKQELANQALGEINGFIQDYGKRNNYRFILGTTNDGSILYASEADDLTQEMIKLLNEKHDNTEKK